MVDAHAYKHYKIAVKEVEYEEELKRNQRKSITRVFESNYLENEISCFNSECLEKSFVSEKGIKFPPFSRISRAHPLRKEQCKKGKKDAALKRAPQAVQLIIVTKDR